MLHKVLEGRGRSCMVPCTRFCKVAYTRLREVPDTKVQHLDRCRRLQHVGVRNMKLSLQLIMSCMLPLFASHY
ncbi:unnamed protein product, partial [Sphacelaria rigidula]